MFAVGASSPLGEPGLVVKVVALLEPQPALLHVIGLPPATSLVCALSHHHSHVMSHWYARVCTLWDRVGLQTAIVLISVMDALHA